MNYCRVCKMRHGVGECSDEPDAADPQPREVTEALWKLADGWQAFAVKIRGEAGWAELYTCGSEVKDIIKAAGLEPEPFVPDEVKSDEPREATHYE